MTRLTLFAGRELWINNQALRHPIDALRHRLEQPTFELRRRTNSVPPSPRAPFAPLQVDIGATLSQSIRHRAVAQEAAEAGQRMTTLRALGLLTKIEDFPTPTQVPSHAVPTVVPQLDSQNTGQVKCVSRPSNLSRGLVAIGQGVLIQQGVPGSLGTAATTGCGPCLGVVVTYDDGARRLALLVHLQPEARQGELAKQLAEHMPDNFNADMHVHVTSAPSEDPTQASDQQARIARLVSEIAGQYDFIVFDEDNVHIYQEESIGVDGATLRVSTSPVPPTFSHDEMEQMRRTMEADPTAVQYFR